MSWNICIITPNRFLLGRGGKHETLPIGCYSNTRWNRFFGSSINPSLAAEKCPFIYFATADPFLKPGQAPTRNDITILGGPFVEDAFGGAIHV